MRYRTRRLGALLASIIVISAPATGAWAQAGSVIIDGVPYALPTAAAKNPDAVRALIAASDALGMTRSLIRTLGGTTQTLQYKATGTMNGQAVTVVAAYD